MTSRDSRSTLDAVLQALAATAGRGAGPPSSWVPALASRGLTPGLHGDTALVVKGCMPVRSVAVVGARAADAYGLALARQLGRELAGAGVAVVSGGAEGCDAAAHEGALEAGGETVVVLPAGHDHAYPKRHGPLFERAARAGAVVSPFWPTVRVARSRFITRNGVIAALSSAVVVVRARERSGTLSTARAAVALGRPVAAVPGAVGETLSAGCHHLLEEGAVPITSRRGLLRWLVTLPLGVRATSSGEWPVGAAGQPSPWGRDLDTEDSDGGRSLYGSEGAGADRHGEDTAACEGVRAVVAQEPGLDLDEIAVRSGLPFSSLVGCLLDLELRGVLERLPGGRYRTTGRGV